MEKDSNNGQEDSIEENLDISNQIANLELDKDNEAENQIPNYDLEETSGELKIKIIICGDSAVGKTKLLERFLVDSYKPKQLSTYALTIYTHKTVVGSRQVTVDIWDTAGQERFASLHPSYYHQAAGCIMVFDSTRKVTYKNLPNWYNEMRDYRPEIPCVCAANKIDANMEVTQRPFNFTEKNNIKLYFVSAADGTNVVKLFRDVIQAAVNYKLNPTDWRDALLEELEKTN